MHQYTDEAKDDVSFMAIHHCNMAINTSICQSGTTLTQSNSDSNNHHLRNPAFAVFNRRQRTQQEEESRTAGGGVQDRRVPPVLRRRWPEISICIGMRYIYQSTRCGVVAAEYQLVNVYL